MAVYDIITRVGTSIIGVDDAIKKLLEDTQKDLNISWFEVKEIRGRLNQEKQIEYQVTVKIGIKKQ
ncbi:MAG TPA: dodecin family protein [Ignavibacteriales bacterium]|nr:dodecin family protein [Ignavibacteriales bacterium]HOL82097.1 dodecin family protein [Ignavibacteriales bacterium]HOM65097.1 dodecin family protein [Ignavibacteriales bacterium]HPD68226.1 dodecin family protein [Ignavibacteriales bacterium]HPP34319.1 dodecin family protein [Ignavibacteriales bacterium]